nr:uncharacterized protein LOC115255917 [Aedes albopictus]
MTSQQHRERGVILGRLTRIEVFIRDIDSRPGITAELIQARLDVLDQCWVDYDTVQTAIEAEDGINIEEEEEKRATFEERCMNARAALRSLIQKMQGSAQTASNTISGQPLVHTNHQQLLVPQQSIEVRLPTLELPTFSGDYMDWPAFRDAFEALINKNVQLSNVQKLLYLKSTLNDEAAYMLDTLDITDANYRVAWDLLVERFENRRILKQKHLKALFTMKQVPEDSPKELRRLLTECQRNINVLRQFGEPTEEWDTILVYLIASKLDGVSRRDWEIQTQDDESPTYDDITKFINSRCHTLEALAADKRELRTPSRSKPQLSHISTSSVGCSTCQSSLYHPLWKCMTFLEMSPAARLDELRKWKLCFNCFSSKHRACKCKSKGCKSCSGKHNTLLHGSSRQHQHHQDQQKRHPFSRVSSSSESSNLDKPFMNADAASKVRDIKRTSNDILATAMVCIYDSAGNRLPCRVLLDSGSQPNFITQSFARKLRLEGSNTAVTVHGVSGAETQVGRRVMATIESCVNGRQFEIPLLVMKRITNVLPSEPFQCDDIVHGYQDLADPTFNKPGDIDILLGSKLFFKLLLPEKIEIGDLILWNSELGRIVSGSYKQCLQAHMQSNSATSITDADMPQPLGRYRKRQLANKLKIVEAKPSRPAVCSEKNALQIHATTHNICDIPMKLPGHGQQQISLSKRSGGGGGDDNSE